MPLFALILEPVLALFNGFGSKASLLAPLLRSATSSTALPSPRK